MKASLQSRVLALVGAGVFVAVGALALLSRSTLLSLEREVRHDHERLASTLARELSRAIGDDLRLVAGAAGVAITELPEALRTARRFGRLSSSAFAVDVDGTLLACEPAGECGAVRRDLIVDATRRAVASGRPYVSDPLTHADGRQRSAAVLPLRPSADRPAAAVGVTIDPADRRLTDLLDTSEIAPTLRVGLRDGRGAALGHRPDPSSTAGYVSTAPVGGTAWSLDLIDRGPDPAAPITALRRRSIWLVPTFAAIAMLLGWGIARSVRGPLVELTAAAERIARGELSERIDTDGAASGGDEIARLATALERMRADLLSSILEIERANGALEHRIEERTRELAALNVRLEQREQLRQTLLRHVISAQEDERRRVARELHDETSQTLAALGIGVDVALAAAEHGSTGDLRRQLQDLRGLVERMHRELQRMITNLRPSLLDDLGLPAAIRWFVDRHVVPAGLTVRCEFSGLDERLPPDIETAVFRAVQESLNNIVRHANAETVLIQACAGDGMLSVEIEDDGDGFDVGAVVRTPESMRGIGLLGMRERMEILGGSATVDSAPGRGTRVAFTVPLVTVPVT